MKLKSQGSSTASSSVLRPLGAFEEFFWLYDQHRPTHFALAAEVRGSTGVGRWREALDLLQRRHPLFSVRIEKEGESVSRFCREMDAPIPLRVIQGRDVTKDWELELERELSIPFDARRAPLVRATLLHQTDRAVCILAVHHSIADGRSIAFAIRDLLQAVAGNPIDLLPLIPSLEELLRISTDGSCRPEKNGESKTLRPRPAATFISEEQARPSIRSLQLSQGPTSKIRERAREEGTTVHGALSAAIALAYWQAAGELTEDPLRVLTPIDTRKLLGLGEECTLLVGSGSVDIERPVSPDFWEIARCAMADLAEAQTLEAIAATRTALHQMMTNGFGVPAAAAFAAQAFAHEILLTNLGKLPYETSFGELKLEAVWGPAVSARLEGARTIGVATTNGRLCLIETSFEPNSLLELVAEILESACQSGAIA